jgi:hypothetical protein
MNRTGRYEDEFHYLSLCGKERNFVRCDDTPVVFTHTRQVQECRRVPLCQIYANPIVFKVKLVLCWYIKSRLFSLQGFLSGTYKCISFQKKNLDQINPETSNLQLMGPTLASVYPSLVPYPSFPFILPRLSFKGTVT